MENTTAEYWGEAYPDLIVALSGLTRIDTTAVAEDLADMAGDHAAMTDDEVLGQFTTEITQRPKPGGKDLPALPKLADLQDDLEQAVANPEVNPAAGLAVLTVGFGDYAVLAGIDSTPDPDGDVRFSLRSYNTGRAVRITGIEEL